MRIWYVKIAAMEIISAAPDVEDVAIAQPWPDKQVAYMPLNTLLAALAPTIAQNGLLIAVFI